jgi:uncharacterized protein
MAPRRATIASMSQGIQFACQPGCTACCEQKGYVYLTQDDVERAAAWLGITVAEFQGRYLARTRDLMRLRVPETANCPFLESGGCAIHPAKPLQCRTFPFWPELLGSRRRWNNAKRYCPGIDQGPLISIAEAEAQAEQLRAAWPEAEE